MKNAVTLLLFASLTCGVYAQITSISIETVTVHDGSVDASLEGYTTYRVYAELSSSLDFVSAVFGDASDPLMLGCTGTIYQSVGVNFNFATEVNPLFFPAFPAAEYDSWFTIGEEDVNGGVNVQNTSQQLAPALTLFNSGAGFVIDDPIGASWFNVFPCSGSPNLAACADGVASFAGADNQVLLAQITATGDVYGLFNLQVFPGGVQADSQMAMGLTFSTNPDDVFGCMNEDATNYDATATIDDLSCILPCALELTIASVESPACSGYGLIQVSTSGAQGADYFFLDSLTGYPSNFGAFGGLESGFYTVFAQDDAGCVDSIFVEVPLTCTPCFLGSNLVCGCTDLTACNYEVDAEYDDDSCVYGNCPGCTIEIACNYNPSASEDDGSCEFYCPGCTDADACNYDESALQEDGSCVYPEDLGQCDCDGGEIDALGDCGGDCAADADSDGVCDDVDPCVGVEDECGVCNGPGAIYDCGCEELGVGECDCDGTLVDQCGVCGGDGTSCVGCTYVEACNYDPVATILDASACLFGVCSGCTVQGACNYNPTLNEDDGSCEWCSCLVEGPSADAWTGSGEFPLAVESYPAVQEGMTTYRFYVNMQDPTDRFSAVYGNNEAGMFLNTPEGAYNNAFNSSWSASGINPVLFATFPEMADDTYATIGLESAAAISSIPNASDPGLVEDADQPITPYFLTDGATALESTTLTGAVWYVLNTAGNGLPDESLRVLILQVTTSGGISGTLNYQVFPLGMGENAVYQTENFTLGNSVMGCTDESAVNYCPSVTSDNGSCIYEYVGCLDSEACNYSPLASTDEGAECVYIQPGECDCDGNVFDACGVCGGDGIPEGQCDCEGNVLDAVGVCGGDCELDANGNGICDVDELAGGPEACGWGTYWNADSAACVLLIPPFLGEFGDYNTLNPCYYDLDLSGTVGAGDLINFLGSYNQAAGCSWTEE